MIGLIRVNGRRQEKEAFMKKRTLWILLTVLFAASALYAVASVPNDGPAGLVGCAILAVAFGMMAKKTDPEARFRKKPKTNRQSVGKGDVRKAMKGDYTAIDLETTGLDPANEKIIELGAVRVRSGKPVSTYSQLVNPSMPVPPQVRRLTGITDSDLADKPTIDKVLPDFLDFIGLDALVGHNIQRFDVPFLLRAAIGTDRHLPLSAIVDTLPLSQQLLPDLPDHKLVTLVRQAGIGESEAHRACDDARQTAQVYEALKAYAKKNHICLQ